jgi:hypothetical protein
MSVRQDLADRAALRAARSGMAPDRPLGIGGRLLLLTALGIGLFVASSDPFALFFLLAYAVLGALLVVRRPRNVIGWLLMLIGFGFVGVATTPGTDLDALRTDTESLAAFLLVWLGAWTPYVAFGGFVALTVVFPSGRLPAGRWRSPSIALLACCVTLAALSAFAPTLSYNPDSGVASIGVQNRLAVLPDLFLWSLIPLDAFILPTVACLALGVVSMLARYRRATGIERLQLRWLVAALAFVVLAVVGGLAIGTIFPAIGGGAWIFTILAFPTVPIAIYIAITRYRLYEIDRIISRTLGWLAVTVLLAAVFAVVNLGLQALLEPVTTNNTLAIAASTLLAAGLFQPVRRRVQHTIDRRFNRARADAEGVAAAFADRLRSEVDLDAIAADVRGTVDGVLAPRTAILWLRHDRGSGGARA